MKALSFSLLLGQPSLNALAAGDYSRDIQPVLAEHCFQCHGQNDHARKGKLRLDQRESAVKGGKSDGPAIVPGHRDISALHARLLSHDEKLSRQRGGDV